MKATGLLSGGAPMCRHNSSHQHIPLPAQRLCARISGNGLACTPTVAFEARQRLQVAAASAMLDDLSASTADSKDEAQPSSAPAAGSSKVDDVPLTSEVLRWCTCPTPEQLDHA